MIMEKLFLNILIIILAVCKMPAQVKQDLILDTLIQADEVYLDPLNHLYLINNAEKSIGKFDLQFRMLKKISFNQGWDHAVMDVSDPFKCLLYYPGDYKILILDESLSVISSYDESELNARSAVCYFSTDYIGIYSNNILKLKNYQQQKMLGSEPLFNANSENPAFPVQLKRSNEFLYLLRPGIGISRYTNQLFQELSWLDKLISRMDVYGDQLFYFSGSYLIKLDTKSRMEEIILKETTQLKSFAVNSEFIIVMDGNHLKLMKWK